MASMTMPGLDENLKPQPTVSMDTGTPGSSDDPTQDAPSPATEAEQRLEKEMQDDLMEVRRLHKEQYAPKRKGLIERCLRAFEVLKNNPYVMFSGDDYSYDTLSELLQQSESGDTAEIYQYNDNIYQMLCLAFMAALSPDVPKVRYQPGDAENEEDLLIAAKGSTIQAFNERRNKIKSLQKLELLYLWTCGCYFAYTRNIVDSARAGVTREPVIAMKEQEVAPNRYVCPQCAAETPEDEASDASMGGAQCSQCKAPVGPADWHPSETMAMPSKVGEKVVPNHMTAMDVYCPLNVDADPEAMELFESATLDLEGEMNVAAVRASYPGYWDKLKASSDTSSGTQGAQDRQARNRITAPSGIGANNNTGQHTGTYSRCWIQTWAFNILDDRTKADRLTAKYPDGVKLVSYGGDFLQAVPERMTDRWTWCAAIKGLGLFPFAVGDAALDVQRRINDTANTVHAYMDRVAFGTILGNNDVIDIDAMTKKRLPPGNITPVKLRSDQEGQPDVPLSNLLFQPEFHIDGNIYNYQQQLIQLAQMIAGVQPQVFGGSDPNVQTMGGQKQMLDTAMGRMQLFWDQIREEHAARAQNSVRCTIENMDEQLRIVVEGDVSGNWQTETILKSEVVGDFMCYPESDEGFPSTFREIQARIMELMTGAEKNPFVMEVLSDPDTQKVVSRYILPDQIKLPTDDERARLKILLHQLSQTQTGPDMIDGPDGNPIMIPTVLPSRDFDDMDMAQLLAKNWLQKNWQTQATNPLGFENVLAFLKVATQYAKEAQMAAAMAAAPPGGPGGPPGLPPPGAGAPPPQ